MRFLRHYSPKPEPCACLASDMWELHCPWFSPQCVFTEVTALNKCTVYLCFPSLWPGEEKGIRRAVWEANTRNNTWDATREKQPCYSPHLPPEDVQTLEWDWLPGYRSTVCGRSWVCTATFVQICLAETLKSMKFMDIKQLLRHPCFKFRGHQWSQNNC